MFREVESFLRFYGCAIEVLKMIVRYANTIKVWVLGQDSLRGRREKEEKRSRERGRRLKFCTCAERRLIRIRFSFGVTQRLSAGIFGCHGLQTLRDERHEAKLFIIIATSTVEKNEKNNYRRRSFRHYNPMKNILPQSISPTVQRLAPMLDVGLSRMCKMT